MSLIEQKCGSRTDGLLSRKFRLFQQQRFHIGKDKARIERAGTVDVPDAAFAIDEKDAQGVIKRTLRIGRVGPFVHGLTIGGENRFQVLRATSP